MLESQDGKLTASKNKKAVDAMVDSLKKSPLVVRVVSPLGQEGAGALSNAADPGRWLPAPGRRACAWDGKAVERELLREALVCRYETSEAEDGVDGLAGREGAFLACSFWLVDALAAIGRLPDARALFGTLLGPRNDLGLLSEMYDPEARRLVGNFPQAFTHLSLVNSGSGLSRQPDGGGLRSRSELAE